MSPYRMATMSRKAAKYRPAGIERLATVVPGSDRAVGRPAAGRAGVSALVVDRGKRLADLQDGRAGEGRDDAGGDLEVHRPLAERGDGPVQPAGRHDRGADGQRTLHLLGLGLHALALPGGQDEEHDRQQGQDDDREVLLHDSCASLPRVQLRGGCGPGWGPLGCIGCSLPFVHGHARATGGTRAAAAGRVARQRPGVYASNRGSDDVPGVAGPAAPPPRTPPAPLISAPPRGNGCPRWCHAASVATRPRGVRASRPARTRNGSQTSSTVLGSSPTATARVATPTGPPPKRTTRASRTARSRRSSPSSSTS